MPTRFAKQLTQVVRGAVAIGIERPAALRLAIRCARDSMPPLRLAILDDVAAHPDSRTVDVRRRLDKPAPPSTASCRPCTCSTCWPATRKRHVHRGETSDAVAVSARPRDRSATCSTRIQCQICHHTHT